MGELARRIQSRLRDVLSEFASGYDWETERRIATTPVDVAGEKQDCLIVVELEWRRADPADNVAKLFRHFSEMDGNGIRTVEVFQLFTSYYDLSSGGMSSKRKNAEFVGEIASRTFDDLEYHALALEIEPPKRGGDLPEGWRDEVKRTSREIVNEIEDY